MISVTTSTVRVHVQLTTTYTMPLCNRAISTLATPTTQPFTQVVNRGHQYLYAHATASKGVELGRWSLPEPGPGELPLVPDGAVLRHSYHDIERLEALHCPAVGSHFSRTGSTTTNQLAATCFGANCS